jgi:ubiquinone/menaquinone biosynthesis C-methylase UbiE
MVPLDDPHRFRTAAAHYRAGRPPYPPALIRQVAQATGLTGAHRVLDLGCGPGQLAIGFAYFAGEILALDPEPAMLAEAQAAATGLTPNVTFREGSSHDVGPDLGLFHLVTMGRSFHWMDRAETLRRLDGIVDPDGAIVLFGDKTPDLPENAWHKPWREILHRYSAHDPIHARRRAEHWGQHEAALLASSFHAFERISITHHRAVSLQSLIDRTLSMSSTSAHRLGDQVGPMLADIKTFFAGAAPGGVLVETLQAKALVARR